MGGGIIQLIAYGGQDIHLIGNPQITFFKAVYKRHTNFSTEAISQTFSGSPDFVFDPASGFYLLLAERFFETPNSKNFLIFLKF